jgi:hypothetical protein
VFPRKTSDSQLTRRLIARALKSRWPIPPERRAELLEQLADESRNGETSRDRVRAITAMMQADKITLEALRAAAQLQAEAAMVAAFDTITWDQLIAEAESYKPDEPPPGVTLPEP